MAIPIRWAHCALNIQCWSGQVRRGPFRLNIQCRSGQVRLIRIGYSVVGLIGRAHSAPNIKSNCGQVRLIEWKLLDKLIRIFGMVGFLYSHDC